MSGTIMIDSAALLSSMYQQLKLQISKEPEVAQQPYSYIVFTDGSKYYAKNGSTGQIDFSGTDAATVINQAINNDTTIVIKKGFYYIKSPIQITDKYYMTLFFEEGATLINQQNDYAIKITSTQRTYAWITLLKPRIYGDPYFQTPKGIYVSYSSGTRIYNPHIENVFEGIRLRAVNTIVIRDGLVSGRGKTLSGSAGIVLENNRPGDTTNDVLLQKLQIASFQYGVYQPYLNGGYSENVSVLDCLLVALEKAIYMTTPVVLNIERNYFEVDDYGIYIDNSGSYVPVTVRILGNMFVLEPGAYNVYISDYCYDVEMDSRAKMGAGSVFLGANVRFSKNGGVATFSGNASQTQFTIPHKLYTTPSRVLVTPGSDDAKGTFYVTADSTYIYVNYTTPPPSGTNNVVLYWYAEV